MKRLMFISDGSIVWSLSVLGIATAGALVWVTATIRAEGSDTDLALPTAIAAFYESRNTLSQLGSKVEREVSIDSLLCQGDLQMPNVHLEYCHYLPEVAAPNQADIQTLILSLEQQILRDISSSMMVVGGYQPGWGSYLRETRPDAIPLTSSADRFPAILYQPISMNRQDENNLSIQVMSCDLESERLFKPLEQSANQNSDPLEFESPAEAESTCFHTTSEWHRWTLNDNQWMKLESDIVLLEP